MAVASVSKITAASPTSFDAAVQEGVARASKTLRGITCLHVIEEKASNPGRLSFSVQKSGAIADQILPRLPRHTRGASAAGQSRPGTDRNARATARSRGTRPTCGNGSDLGRHWPFASASRRFSTSPAGTSGAEFPQVLRM